MTDLPSELACPYCGTTWRQSVTGPPLPARLSAAPPHLASAPRQVETMPYVRDVGTFDPDLTTAWDDPRRGSWVGSDFIPAVRFDRRFGILTSQDGGWPGVLYRVERCPRCLHHLDAYYSFHPTLSLHEQFPHLFAADHTLLDIPDHEPLPRIFVQRMDLASSGGSGSVVAAVAVWWGLSAAAMALARLVVDRFTWLEYVVAAVGLLFGLAIAGYLLHLLQRLLGQLSDQVPMDRVLACDGAPSWPASRRANAVRHWVSFTRCRFTGRPATGHTLRTATELLGGVTAATSLVLVVLLSGDLAPQVFLPRLVDAFWWFPVAYMLGSSLQLAATAVHYVLAGLTRVPLRLDEVHPAGDLLALRAIQRYVKTTGTTAAVLLVTLLAGNAALRQALDGRSPLAWVDLWFLVIVLLGLVSLGLTHTRSYLVLALVVGSVTAVLRDAPDLPLPLDLGWSLDPVTVWLGAVFTLMLVTETRHTNELVERAMRNTVEARAAEVLRHCGELSPGEVQRRQAELAAASVVLEMRSGVSSSAAWFPLVISVLLPAALDSLISSVLLR